MPLNDADRDLMIRTVIGEAGDQTPAGQAAVAHVILNRVANGQWGDSPSRVVLASGQFEPWQTRSKELIGINAKSPQYQKVGQIVDSVSAGSTPDPTNGATHFLDPNIVKARRGGSLPDWAQGQSVSIGDHRFYAPGNPNYGDGGVAAINAAIGASSAPGKATKALAYTDAPESPQAAHGDLFRGAGFTVPTKDAAQPASTAGLAESAPVAPGALFKDAGFTLPTDKPPAPVTAPAAPLPPGASGAVYIPGDPNPSYIDAAGKIIPAPKPAPVSSLQAIREGLDPSNILHMGDPISAAGEAFSGGKALAGSGITDIGNRKLWPAFPSSDPRSWEAGGVLKTAAGTLGMAASPISGATDALVSQPVTALTGNPDVGARAGLLAGLAIPGPKAVSAAKQALPTTKAINTLVDAIGPENVPALAARLGENPRLSVMDVSDPVRTMAQGLIDPAQPKAQNVLTQAIKDRTKAATGIVNDAYTQAMGPAPDVMKMVEGLKERARAAGREAIQPALENAKPVDVTPVIKAIDAEVKPGMMALLDPGTQLPLSPLQQELVRFRAQLTSGSEQAFDPKRLHEIQSRMGDQAYQLSISPDPKDRMLGSQLRNFNEKLIDQIDAASGDIPLKSGNARFYIDSKGSVSTNAEAAKAVPGSRYIDLPTNSRASLETLADPDKINQLAQPLIGAYRAARAKFKDAKDIHEAFDSGFDTLKNRAGLSGLEDRPEAFKAWMGQATPEEIVARRLGTRADIDQKINGVKNPSLAGQTITKIPYNQQKLEMLFGPKEARRLIGRMEDAGDQAITNAKLVAGAKTAETLAGREALKVPEVQPFHLGSATQALLPAGMAEIAAESYGAAPGLTGAALLAGGIGLGLARKGVQKVSQSSALARNVEIARAASATGTGRQQTINALLAHPKVVRALQKPGNALTVPRLGAGLQP